MRVYVDAGNIAHDYKLVLCRSNVYRSASLDLPFKGLRCLALLGFPLCFSARPCPILALLTLLCCAVPITARFHPAPTLLRSELPISALICSAESASALP